jgi:hypothetical protein
VYLLMAIALVTSFSAGSTNGNGFTSGTFNDSGANLRVVAVCEQGARDAVITDSDANTWTKIRQENGGFAAGVQLWYAYNITGGSGKTITLTCTNGNLPSFALVSFSGTQVADPFDQQNGASSLFTSTQQPGSVTPTSNDQVLVSALGALSDDGVGVIDGGFTVRQTITAVGSQNLTVSIAELIQTTAAAANPTWTYDGTENIAVIGTFKAAAGGGGAVKRNNLMLFGVGR